MRGFVKYLFGIILVLVLAWVGLWWYAEGRMESGFTAWADKLATEGWKVSYGGDQRGTSPLRATLTLTDLVVTAPPDLTGKALAVTIPSLTMRVEPTNPLVLHWDIANKIGFAFGPGMDVAVTFGSITQSARLDPKAVLNNQPYVARQGELDATNIDVLASQGSLLVLHLDHVSGNFSIDPDAGSNAMAFTGMDHFDGISLSPLMTRLLSIPFDGKIASLQLGVNISGPVPSGLQDLQAKIQAVQGDRIAQQKLIVPVIHQWASAGGNGSWTLNGVVGPMALNTDAAVKFDAQQQPEGNADIKATHLDQFLTAVTNAYPEAQPYAAQLEAVLTPYLTTNDQDGQVLGMNVTYGDGAVNVNGKKVAPLKPVDWNALANPPPPAPVAPVAPNDGSGTDTPPPAN